MKTFAPIFVLTALVACSSVVEAQQKSRPGLSATRPTEGRFVETDQGFMVPYTVTIPGSDVSFEMVPIPGGTFTMGSPASEEGRSESEGPQFQVTVQPFWMQKTEVRWIEYKEFMNLYTAFKDFEIAGVRTVTEENRIDAITAPTELYEPEYTFEYGEEDNQAAVTMTQLSAREYTKWMTAITGTQFRLPLDTEWEYACRAGTTTRWSFGDDPALLDEYAWYDENTDGEGQKYVGLKKPNPWGLHDMHGNVAEWVMDGFNEKGFPKHGEEPVAADDAAVWPTDEYPRTVRGGSWENTADECRSASRFGSDQYWKETDPNLPKSPWWFTDDPARGVGFRIMRPLNELPREKIERFWKIDHEYVQMDVDARLEEGRGVLGPGRQESAKSNSVAEKVGKVWFCGVIVAPASRGAVDWQMQATSPQETKFDHALPHRHSRARHR